jgi:hypothetical protein
MSFSYLESHLLIRDHETERENGVFDRLDLNHFKVSIFAARCGENPEKQPRSKNKMVSESSAQKAEKKCSNK